MKKKQRFKIGDKVRTKRGHAGCYETCTGTVKDLSMGDVGVQLDKYHVSGHDLRHQCADGLGWYFNPDNVEPFHVDVKGLIKQKPIHVPSVDKYKDEMGL